MDHTTKYDDIINLPHHTSTKRARKPMPDRAAQFSPFSALTGYEDAIQETGRLTEQKVELTEESKAALNIKLQQISQNIRETPFVTVTHFLQDKRKAGGKYVQTSGYVRRIDEYHGTIIFTDQTEIMIEHILKIDLRAIYPDRNKE